MLINKTCVDLENIDNHFVLLIEEVAIQIYWSHVLKQVTLIKDLFLVSRDCCTSYPAYETMPASVSVF